MISAVPRPNGGRTLTLRRRPRMRPGERILVDVAARAPQHRRSQVERVDQQAPRPPMVHATARGDTGKPTVSSTSLSSAAATRCPAIFWPSGQRVWPCPTLPHSARLSSCPRRRLVRLHPRRRPQRSAPVRPRRSTPQPRPRRPTTKTAPPPEILQPSPPPRPPLRPIPDHEHWEDTPHRDGFPRPGPLPPRKSRTTPGTFGTFVPPRDGSRLRLGLALAAVAQDHPALQPGT
jgi:hypothetical protein